MSALSEIFSAAGTPETMSDYLRLFQQLKQAPTPSGSAAKEPLRVALLSSFTTKGLKEVLTVVCTRAGMSVEVYTGDYNQYVQETLNSESGLYAFNPGVIILFVDTQTLWGEEYFTPYAFSTEERQTRARARQDEFRLIIDAMKKNFSGSIVVHNCAVPTYSPYGIMERKQAFGFLESIEMFNSSLYEDYRGDARVFVFDYDAFCSSVGKKGVLDERLYYVGDFRLTTALFPALSKEYVRYLQACFMGPKKCIVLDLDNTLWGGVIGEDGVEKIALGPTREGRSFWEFQKYLLAFFQRGILLAVNSKNNHEDVMTVFREHPYMVLKEKHFAATRINWTDKATNVRELAQEMNIGLDSLVFIDDDPVNRDLVRSNLPEVTVVEMPADPSGYVKTLQSHALFETVHLTDEDKKRGEMYAAEKQRTDFKSQVLSLDDYLRGLEMVVTLSLPRAAAIARVAQLTQRTNQWNMTTKRYAEEAIGRLAADAAVMMIGLEARDRFGDNGLSGLTIVRKQGSVWDIDTLLMSCRIIGRGIERVLLWYIITRAKEEGVEYLEAVFIPTKKNAVAQDFYKQSGFLLKDSDSEKQLWQYDLQKEYIRPDFITINLP